MFQELKAWHLSNEDQLEIIQGQFHAENLTEDVSATYADHFTINRQHAITQFVHGNVETLTFQGLLFAKDADDVRRVRDTIRQLKSWVRRDDSVGRTPILSFWAGDGHAELQSCVMDSISNIRYEEPTDTGALRKVSFNISLRQYTPFSLTTEGVFETRYHRARQADYYEALCEREYGDPDLGDIIRKRHPTKPNIQTGDIIKLPSIEAIRNDVVTQTSIPLQTAFGRKNTPQRARMRDMFTSRNIPFTSHVLK